MFSLRPARRSRALRSRLALLTAVSLLVPAFAPLAAAQAAQTKPAAAPAAQTKPAAAPAARPASAAAAAPAPPDGGWPRAYTTASGATLVLYQPQVSSWTDQKHIVAYNAISYTPKGAAKPALGTIKVESDTRVSLDERLVSFSELKISEPNFSTLPREQLRTLVEEIGTSIPLEARVIALDRVLASIDTSKIVPEERRGRESGSAADLLQQDAGGPREHRRRSGLGADSAERSHVGRQHQLGPVPARSDQDLLSPRRRARG